MADLPPVAILVPMLGRAERIEPLLGSLRAAMSSPYRVVLIYGDDDHAVHDHIWAHHRIVSGADVDHVEFYEDPTVRPVTLTEWASGAPGDYARKINTAAAAATEPWLFLGAIDLRFCPGWYERAMARVARNPQVGVVGTNDCCNRRTMDGQHSTHSLVSRAYVDEFGTIDEPGKVLHEGYAHEYVDDEFVRTAQFRRLFVHATNAHVEHLHPMCGKASSDRVYAQQAQRMAQGREVFLARQHLWEGTVRP